MNVKVFFMFLSLALVQLLAPLTGHAAQISLLDDFNDGVLDPAWEITTYNVKNWTYQETGTKLTVTSIVSSLTGWDNSGATVWLGRSFEPVGDFKVDFDISWSKTNVSQLGWLGLYLITGGNVTWESLSSIIYNGNSSTSYRGHISYQDTNGPVPNLYRDGPSGSASIDISRTNGLLMVMVDGVEMIRRAYNAPINDPISGIILSFYGGGVTSNPDSPAPLVALSVDKIQLTGTTVASTATPEPGSLLLMGGSLSLMALVRYRNRRRDGLAPK